MQHRGKQKKCIVQHLLSEKFDRDQTSYNKIQHDKTRYNKVAKRVQHFIKHQSCIMSYEMLYSFGRGLTERVSTLTCKSLFETCQTGMKIGGLKVTAGSMMMENIVTF